MIDKGDSFFDYAPQPEWPDVSLPPLGPGKVSDTAKQVQVVEGHSKKADEAQRVEEAHCYHYAQIVGRERAQRQRAMELAAQDGSAASWEPIELGPWLSGESAEVEPSVLVREDGARLFYAGSNLLFGDSGTGKSLVMCAAVAQEIAAGRVCVWLDYEETTPGTTVSRLLALGVDKQAVQDRLVWMHPVSAATPEMLAKVVSTAQQRAGEAGAVGLVVVDSVGEALAVEGLNEDRDAEVGPWMNRVKTLNAELPDAALVFIDHSTKAKDGAAKFFPSGSKRKRASLTGVTWLAETVEESAKGKPGSVQLVCAKDRHGNFRRGEPGVLVCVAPAAEGCRVSAALPAGPAHNGVGPRR